MGGFTIKGVDYAKKVNDDKLSPFHGKLDLQNLVLVCGPFGPPPCLGPGILCNTWMPADFKTANAKMPIVLTTATNDGAFWPAPHTAQHELGCFHKSTDDTTSKNGALFAQFSSDACADDGKGG